MPILRTVLDKSPIFPSTCFLAETATLIGDVVLGEQSSVWFGAILRGDVGPIRIGARTNIQDGSIIHGTFGKHYATLGDDITVGHQVVLHGCKIDDLCLIGMGSIVMDGVYVEKESIIGAGSLLVEGTHIPSGSLVFGRPAKVVRPLNPKERAFLRQSAQNYLLYSSWYQASFDPNSAKKISVF